MRLVLGVGLAATLALTGCGTQLDPFQDDEADALEVAWQACEIWNNYPDQDSPNSDYFQERRWSASSAGDAASQAAYLDPRWRTLADAFPYVERRYEILAEDAGYIEDDDGSRVREALRDQVSLWDAYENAVYSECSAVYVLRGDRESYYDMYFADPEGDPDTE